MYEFKWNLSTFPILGLINYFYWFYKNDPNHQFDVNNLKVLDAMNRMT